MGSQSTSFVRPSITKMTIGLLFALAIVFLPQAAAAQCVTCGFAYTEKTFECMDAPVGAHWCLSGASYDFESDEWLSWCVGGGFCEWITHLDFGEDGTAYVQNASTPGVANDRLVGLETTITSPKTCDGVLLGVRTTKVEHVVSEAPVTLEI